MSPVPPLFDYTLPPELIAQEPCEPRDQARLLVADRRTGSLAHYRFAGLPGLLNPGDLLVLNDTRVLPARLLGKRAATGGKWEGLFLGELADATWEMLCQTRGTLREGEIIDIDADPSLTPQAGERLRLQLLERLPKGRWRTKPLLPGTSLELLECFGHVPLPPYICKGADRPEDRARYQTIYASQAGAVAAPTAGLHFTERLFAGLPERGIGWTAVTLHVGLATFQPIQAEDYTRHPMHAERGSLGANAATAINACKARGGRIVAVGTTAVRVLETAARNSWTTIPIVADGASHDWNRSPRAPLQPWAGETDLFIHPPYQFQIVDALITNFHLPRTTLLLLVTAFAGADLAQRAYETAIAERYRFFSYGDAMLIV